MFKNIINLYGKNYVVRHSEIASLTFIEQKKFLLTFVFPLMILPLFSIAQGTFNSNTPAGGNWNVAGSWTLIAGVDLDGIPDGNDDAIILASHTINFTATTACNNLTIIGTLNMNTGGTTLTVNANLTMDVASAISGTASATKDIIVSGNFIVLASATSATIGGFDFSVSGTSTINGSLDWTNATGTKTLTGDITVNGTWTNTSPTEDFTMAGNLTNNGTFSSGNIGSSYSFIGSAKSIGGTNSITIGDALVSGTFTNNLINPASLIITDDLLGVGSVTQSVGASLFIGDDATINLLNASAVPNTVTYNGTAAGSIKCATYHHLAISKTGGGTAAFVCSTTINGDLTINSGTLLSDNGVAAYTHTVLGSTYILAGLPGGIYNTNINTSVLNVQNLTMNGGTITGGGATVAVNVATTLLTTGTASFINAGGITVTGAATINAPITLGSNTGVKTFQGLVTVNPTGSWTSAAITTTANLVFQNSIVSNGTSFSASDATFLLTASQTLSGATPMIFADDITISGAFMLTNQITTYLDINGILNGTVAGSTWRNDPSTRLNYAGTTAPMAVGVLDVSALSNVVNYDLAGNQNIRSPLTTYYHLELAVSGTKDFLGNTNVSGNLTLTGSAQSSAGAFTHNVTGTTYIFGTANLNHNSAAGVYNLANLELTTTGGTNVGNSAGAAGTTNVSGTLLVNAGTSLVTRCNFTVTGTTTVNGTLTVDDINASVKTFIGSVTVNGGASWTSTGITSTGNLVFRGGIVSNGTSFSAGSATFNTNAQTIGGTTSVSFANNVTVTVININNNLVSPDDLTIGIDLLGTGGVIQGVNSILNIGDDATLTTLIASANPNIVNYNTAAVGSDIKQTTYHHLYVSKTGPGDARFAGNTTVNGNFTIYSGICYSDNGAPYTHTVSGVTSILSTFDFNTNGNTVNLYSLFMNNGSIAGGVAADAMNVAATFATTGGVNTIAGCAFTVFDATTIEGTVSFTNDLGVKTFTGLVAINPAATWTSTSIVTSGNAVFKNGIVSNGTSFSAGGVTFNTNSQGISGATPLFFANIVTVTGVIVTNNTTVDMTNAAIGTLAGTGNWTQGAGSTLNYGGLTLTVTTFDASALNNRVNYSMGGNQTVRSPSNSYYYINLSASGTKTFSSDVYISKDLFIQGTAIVDASGINIFLAGDWDNSSTAADPLIEGTGTVTFNGSAMQNINNTGDADGTVFNNLTINNPTAIEAVRLNAAVNFNGTLNLTDGHITTTAANILTGGPSAGVVLAGTPQDSSFVKGPMNHVVDVAAAVTKVYPIGKENNYRRVDLTIDQIPVTSTTYTAEMIPSSAIALGYTVPGSLTHVSGIRHYEITQSPSTGLDNAQVKVYFQCMQNNDVVQDLADLAIAKDNGAGAWIDLGGAATGAICGGIDYSGSILSGSFTTFSKFALANKTGGSNPLPVELFSFEAKPNGNNVDVTWSTASESNSDYFIVERSKDGDASSVWEYVDKVNASGNSSTINNYSSIDYEPYNGMSYYRLKQVDNDGKIFFSNIIAVDFNTLDDPIAVYPNPVSANNPVNVSLSGLNGEEILIAVRDLLGKEFYSKVIVVSNDNEVFAIDPSGKLSIGVYLIVASTDKNIYKKKLVIR